MSSTAARPAPTAIALGLLLLATATARASDDEITLRVNDTEAAAGGIATVVIRTYAPRPVGQGQISLGTSSRPRLTSTPSSSRMRPGSAAAVDSPFSEFLDGEVLSSAADAAVSFDFVDAGGAIRVMREALRALAEAEKHPAAG
jgi:hypothetical protein